MFVRYFFFFSPPLGSHSIVKLEGVLTPRITAVIYILRCCAITRARIYIRIGHRLSQNSSFCQPNFSSKYPYGNMRYLIGRVGASPPSRTTGPIFLYNIISITSEMRASGSETTGSDVGIE